MSGPVLKVFSKQNSLFPNCYHEDNDTTSDERKVPNNSATFFSQSGHEAHMYSKKLFRYILKCFDKITDLIGSVACGMTFITTLSAGQRASSVE